MSYITKIRTVLAIPQSFVLCLWYLPFRQAIKIPIIVYKPKFYCLKGKVIIDSEHVHFGMIRLGIFIVNQYPNRGISWYNKGTIIFKGKAYLGANSAIALLRKDSYVEFGDNVGASTSVKINCDYRIVFEDNVLMGWDVTIMDSSMHRLKNSNGDFIGKGYGEIRLGMNTWVATQCLIMANTQTPAYSVIGARSMLNKDYTNYPEKTMFAGTPAKFIKTGVWRDLKEDGIKITD